MKSRTPKVQVNRLRMSTWQNRYGEELSVGEMETSHIQRVMNMLDRESQHYYDSYRKWLQSKIILFSGINADEHARFYGFLKLVEEKAPLDWLHGTPLYSALYEEYVKRTANRTDVDRVDELRRVISGMTEDTFNRVAELIMFSVDYDQPQSNLDVELESLYKSMLKNVTGRR